MTDITHNGIEDEPLFSPSIIDELPETITGIKLYPPVTVKNPGENLVIRPLKSGDYDRGYLQLLAQLTKVGDYSKKQFLDTFKSLKNCPDTYFITVIEDKSLDKVIGTATLVIEKKFIRNCGLAGKLEDVVINDEYRGKQLGKLIITAIRLLAERLGCYKVILNCKDDKIGFYQNMGFVREDGNDTMMAIRLKEFN